jgi:hypothetical protein
MNRNHLLGALGIPPPPPHHALGSSPSPHSSDEGVSHLQYSCAIAPLPPPQTGQSAPIPGGKLHS